MRSRGVGLMKNEIVYIRRWDLMVGICAVVFNWCVVRTLCIDFQF
jgi:hypothetical protein